MRWVALVILTIFTLPAMATEESHCAQILSEAPSQQNPDPSAQVAQGATSVFVAYMDKLLELQIMHEQHLLRLAKSLELGRLSNPITVEEADLSLALLIHREGLQEHLGDDKIDDGFILNWVNEQLESRGLVSKKRQKVASDTLANHQPMEFHRIPKGDFEGWRLGQGTARIPIQHEFEMMSTPVTQHHWVELMGENPSDFKEGGATRQVQVNDQIILMQPDHPVESVTWWSAIEFANLLSLKHGLQPVYNTDDIEYEGRLEDGSLRRVSGELRIEAPGGSVYQAEGYRLPTEDEWEYVARNLGKSKADYYFDLVVESLTEHAWFTRTSSGSTQPVAELKPLVINGRAFYDVYGNVYEWSHPAHLTAHHQLASPLNHGCRGGSWKSYESGANARAGLKLFQNDATNEIGFRLVRSLK